MAQGRSIIDLRNLLAERFPQQPLVPAVRLATGLESFDEKLGGGLPKGALTELSSPHPSAGTALLIHRLLDHAHREHRFLALIDGRDSFDPHAAGNNRLRNLLWVRCRKAGDAIKAADLLLRDGNFPLILLDLVLNPAAELRKIPQTSWYRLQRLVEPVSTAFLILTRHSIVPSAQVKLALEQRWTLRDLQCEERAGRWRIGLRRMHVAGYRQAAAG